MEIILVRHGKPESATNPRLTALGYTHWVRRYNRSKVAADSFPCHTLSQRVDAHYLVASDLPRAIDSVQICLKRQPTMVDADFREMEIPRYRLPFKLKAWTWVYLSRGLWMLGLKGSFESFQAAKLRAERGCEKLIALAEVHDKVVLFGHGYMNLYLRKALIARGWQVKVKSNQYWGVSHLEY